MRPRTLALALIVLLAISLSACRNPGPKPTRRPALVATTPAPVFAKFPAKKVKPVPPVQPVPPAERAGCVRTGPTHGLRFIGKHRLRSGVTVCIHAKPDLMLSMIPPLGPRYAEVLPLAQKGNPEAQFKLAVILNQCTNTPATAAALKTTVATALKTRRYLGGTRVEEPKSFERQLRQEHVDCEGVDPAQRGRSRAWAKSAAAAGLMDAQESLMLMTRPGNVFYLSKRDTKENNIVDAAHHKDTMNALVAARDAGSVDAMLTLGGRYAQDDRDDPPWEREYFDPMKSYAHFAAFDQVQQAIGGKRREPLKGTWVGDIYASLTAQQRVTAEALAKTFVANPRCCVVIE